MRALQKSGAIPVEIIAGRRRIKPSTKAKRAAGIYSSDERESKSESKGANVKAGSKRKASKGKVNSTSNKKKTQKSGTSESSKKVQVCKKTHVDSDDAESTDEGEEPEEDQAAAGT
jgi:hypothetical protein